MNIRIAKVSPLIGSATKNARTNRTALAATSNVESQ